MLLTCVKCTSVLDKAQVGGIEVDLCPACGGLWLDRGELDKLKQTPAGEVDSLRQALTGGQQAGLSDAVAACPRCSGQLNEVKLGRVLVDFCSGCRGVFLDKGELDAALAALKGATIEQLLSLAGSVSG